VKIIKIGRKYRDHSKIFYTLQDVRKMEDALTEEERITIKKYYRKIAITIITFICLIVLISIVFHNPSTP
jgi:hypothetical protein